MSAGIFSTLSETQSSELVAAVVALLIASISALAIFMRTLGRRMAETKDAATGTHHVAEQWNGQTRDLLVNGLQALVAEVQGMREDIRGLRADNTALRHDMTALRSEVRVDIDELRRRLHDHEADAIIHLPAHSHS